jgi:hypothetical protein
MIPGPYESNQGFVRSFIHLGTSKAFVSGRFLVQQLERLQRIILSFSGGAGPCSHSMFGIGIALSPQRK